MSDNVLDQVSLGYQLYWNAQREPAAVALAVGTHGAPLTDGPALLAALQGLWPGKALPLLLAVETLPDFSRTIGNVTGDVGITTWAARWGRGKEAD
jgi:Na+/H+-dicarboxylate symporter